MNTRSSSRGSKSNSFSRPRGSSATRGNIPVDLQSTCDPKPKVVHSPKIVHSPTAIPRVSRTQSSNSLNSAALFQDISVMDNQNSVSQPHLVETSEERFSRSSLNPNVNPYVFPSTSTTAPLVPNTTSTNSTNTPSFDSLVAFMEQTIRNTQDEFRRELSVIRESISHIGITSNDTQDRHPELAPHVLNSPNSNILSGSQNKVNSDSNVKLEKWKISYNGIGSVKDFLFKVETLYKRSKCSVDHLLSNFHILLDGRAEEWYWLFMRQNTNITYSVLHDALIREFGRLESDQEIILKISLRKQQYKETYDEFHTSIVNMNMRLRNPLPDSSIIDILKRNLNQNLRFLLFNAEGRDLNAFRDVARKAEKVLRDTKFPSQNNPPVRNISEINTLSQDITDPEIIDPQIEAIQFNNRKVRYDYSGIQCWNCMDYGHSYIYCSHEIKRPFCFKCGQKDTLTPKCPNKHSFQGNRNVGEVATGDLRPPSQTPSLK